MKAISFTLGSKPTELHGAKSNGALNLKSNITGDTGDRSIDANLWLSRAAEHYHISPRLSDYIMVPVPSIISDLPNTNGDSVVASELLRFDPSLGQLAYKTWVGKPTHTEHQNKDITQAKGVILDVFLRPLTGFQGKHFKVVKLLAFDRTKDQELCQKILNREINTYSLGMYFKSYACSVCNHVVGSGGGQPCEHTRVRRRTYMREDGQLVYRNCQHISGFETSLVSDPAYTIANSDIILNPMTM